MKQLPGAPGPEKGRRRQSHTTDGPGSDLTWGVGAVAARLGVAASTLRTWERRYGVGPSHRTQGGHRRYTERDIDRVELMRRLVGRGVSAQDAARVARHLDRDELEIALSQESDGDGIDSADLVDAIGAAALTGDYERLRTLCSGVLEQESFASAWRQVLAPSLTQLAAERADGTVSAEAERQAATTVAEAMRERREELPHGSSGRVVLASVTPEAHALPFVALATGLAHADADVRVVGPEISWQEIYDLAERTSPDVLVVWDGDLADVLAQRYLDAEDTGFLVRATACWPHEMAVRFGSETRAVRTDVTEAVRLVLDRVS